MDRYRKYGPDEFTEVMRLGGIERIEEMHNDKRKVKIATTKKQTDKIGLHNSQL